MSVGDLSPEEILSIRKRLLEVMSQFAQAYWSTGLSCFVNDGLRAGQETPHVLSTSSAVLWMRLNIRSRSSGSFSLSGPHADQAMLG